MQELLPRMRAHGIAEQRLIIAPLQLVRAAVLIVGPAGGQVVHRVDIVVDDRLVAQRRPHDTEAAFRQRADKALQAVLFEGHGSGRHGPEAGLLWSDAQVVNRT